MMHLREKINTISNPNYKKIFEDFSVLIYKKYLWFFKYIYYLNDFFNLNLISVFLILVNIFNVLYFLIKVKFKKYSK